MTDTLTTPGADLAGLLAQGERAAFHGPPGAAVVLLERAVVTAQERGLRGEAAGAAWLLGQALSAAGRYGSAVAVLGPLVEAGDGSRPEQRLFASLSASTSAGVQRALGRHAAAEELDDVALALADTVEAAADARLGLGSDALGLGRLDEAREQLDAATTLVAGRTELWRHHVRLGMARAELAAHAGEAETSASLAAGAVEAAEAARAPGLVARALLVEGLALVHAGDASAAGSLRRAATLAESLGALPVVWPSRALLAALLAGADEAEAARCLAAARQAVLAIAEDLPVGVRQGWLARAEVTALLEG